MTWVGALDPHSCYVPDADTDSEDISVVRPRHDHQGAHSVTWEKDIQAANDVDKYN